MPPYSLRSTAVSGPEASSARRHRRKRHASVLENARAVEAVSLRRPSSQAPRAGLEPATNRLHRVPPFPTGVDYLITLGLAACRWRALEGSLFFRHSLVSAPSPRRSTRGAWLRITVCSIYFCAPLHLGFPEFTRFFVHQFPGDAAERHSRLLYQLSYRGMLRLYRTTFRVAIRVTSRDDRRWRDRRS